MSEAIEKKAIIEDFKQNDKDTGSPEVQIALLTARIKHLTEHLRVHRKDLHTRHGLLKLSSRRRKLLNYLKKNNLNSYKQVVERLGLRG